MSRRGGYTIVNFADVALIEGAAAGVKIAGTTAAIADAGKKATLVSGLVVDDVKYDDLYVNFNLTADGYLGVVMLSKDSGIEILVEDGDYVTVTAFEIGSGGGGGGAAITDVSAIGLDISSAESQTIQGLYSNLRAAGITSPIYLTGCVYVTAGGTSTTSPVPVIVVSSTATEVVGIIVLPGTGAKFFHVTTANVFTLSNTP